MKATNVTVPVLVAAGVNIVYDMRNNGGKDVTRIIFGNVALFAGLTAIGEFIDWEIAAMLAVLYLLHTMLTDGVKTIEWVTSLTNSL